HDKWIFSSQLQGYSRQTFSRRFGNPAPDSRGSGKTDDGYTMIGNQSGAGGLSASLNNVQHPIGYSGFRCQLPENPSDLRGIFRSLQNHRIPANKRREDLPCNIGKRRIGRNNQPGNSPGLPNRMAILSSHAGSEGAAIQPHTFSGKVFTLQNGSPNFTISI